MTSFANILTTRCDVSDEAMAAAERTKAERGGQLGEILIQQKTITEPELLKALSHQLEIPFWPKLPLNDIDAEQVSKVPIQFLKKHSLVPLIYRRPLTPSECVLEETPPGNAGAPLCGGGCVIAIREPLHFQALDDLVRT